MPETPDYQGDDEIDLRELALTLWQGRLLIAGLAAAFLSLASGYLHIAERTYTVTMTARPMQGDEGGPNLGGFAGLAGLAGISLPSGSGGDFDALPMMMTAPEVTAVLAEDPEVLRYFFRGEWDTENAAWRAPPPSTVSRLVGGLKLILTGEARAPYVAPDAHRLADRMKKDFSANIDTKSGRLNISIKTPDPAVGASLLIKAFKATDHHFRAQFMQTGASSIEFYQSQLARARAAEHREALARVIAAEQQKLMLATRSEFFVADILTGPTASLEPTAPRSSMVLALSIVLGLIAGSVIVVIRKAIAGRPADES